MKAIKMFPSPLGELYFLIARRKDGKNEGYQVSVPSRGAIFLKLNESTLTGLGYVCFRPLSGSYIS